MAPSSVDASRVPTEVEPEEVIHVQKAAPRAKRFRSDKARGRYEQFLSRDFIEEVQVEGKRFGKEGILKLIKWNTLEQLFCHKTVYVPDIVREFYSNWNPTITNPRSRWFKKFG